MMIALFAMMWGYITGLSMLATVRKLDVVSKLYIEEVWA